MKTYIAYFDETGDDGNKSSSSETFVLTSLCMPAEKWQSNYDIMKSCRQKLKKEFGFHVSQEMHTKHFLTDKSPYREYGWTNEERRIILKQFIAHIAALEVSCVNVIIDKEAKTIKLEQNYRSSSKILDTANKIIANNKNRIVKNLWTENKGGREVSFVNYYNDLEEAEMIATKITNGTIIILSNFLLLIFE